MTGLDRGTKGRGGARSDVWGGVWAMSSKLQSIDPTFIFARLLLQEELGTKQQSVEGGKLPLDPLNYVTDVDGNIRETTHNLPTMEHVYMSTGSEV